MQKQLIALLVITSLVFGSWGITRLTNNQPMKARGSLRVSPDSKYIVSIGMRDFNLPELLLLSDIQTGEESQIHTFINGYSEISWSSDGKNILYREDTTLFRYNLESGEHNFLINAKIGKYSPVGNKLAYLKDSTVYVRDLETGLDTVVYHKQYRRIALIDWPTNSKDYLYIVEQISSDGYTKRLLSIRLSDLLVKEIYTTAKNDDYVVGLGLTRNDYQFNSFIENNEQKIVIVECNPHQGNQRDSIYLYQTNFDSLRLIVNYENNGGGTGFLAPKWSANGKKFIIQQGTELVDYGCWNTVMEYNFATDSLSDIIYSYGAGMGHDYYSLFMNPIYIDSNRAALISIDMSKTGVPLELHIADKTVSISENVLDSKKISITNYPNPFNNSTVINYTLSIASNINLAIYNTKGELVKNLYIGHQLAGQHTATFNATGLNSGVYFVKLNGEKMNVNRKVLLIK